MAGGQQCGQFAGIQSQSHTKPQLLPVTSIVGVLTLLRALQIFGTVQVLTNGGPGYHTEVPALHIYKEAFQSHRFGSAAAMSVLFGAIPVALSLLQIWIARRFTNVEGYGVQIASAGGVQAPCVETSW